MARYTLSCPLGASCDEIIEVRHDVNLGDSEPPGAYRDCMMLAYERMAAHLHDSHGARSPQERHAEKAATLAASLPASMLLLSAAVIPGRQTTMHDHPIAGKPGVRTHHGHSGGHVPHAHPDGDWREQWRPGDDGSRHVHALRGQVLTHDHEGGSVPHGYYDHPEDPRNPNRRTRLCRAPSSPTAGPFTTTATSSGTTYRRPTTSPPASGGSPGPSC